MNQTTKWSGFHGTSALNASLISRSSFKVSTAKQDWLGSGAYFFIEGEGVEDPFNKACEWAIFRAYKAKPRYTSYAVLKAHIDTPVFLDLDDTKHIAALNTIREQYIAIIKAQGKRPSGKRLEDKCIFCNFVMNEHNVDALIRREYIKTSREDLDFGFEAGVPNCRILCLKHPKASIQRIEYALDRGKVP
ncbi:hypothetical protein [Serratia fonticola]|uniref:hypothetical protein n=1 Tax=Serratia fonticola TaxID=47917 RepID=UPI000BA28F0C|nr:hypothetical protein [Serratia fonticola]PAA95497.1 hypothetical protein CJJ13_21945 [Serratia fonticola]